MNPKNGKNDMNDMNDMNDQNGMNGMNGKDRKNAPSGDTAPVKDVRHDRGHRISGRYHMYKGDAKTAFTRGALVIVGILLQFAVMLLSSLLVMRYAVLLYVFLEIVGVVFAIYIVYDSESYRYFWLVIILLFPVVGLFLYFMWGSRLVSLRSRKRLTQSIDEAHARLPKGQGNLARLEAEGHGQLAAARYLTSERLPLYGNTAVRYYPLGDDMRADFLADLRSAEDRIWLEFFILLSGEVWDEVEEILEEKVRSGVDVRILIDDVGSIRQINRAFKERMREKGIHLAVFAPIHKDLTKVALNYRNHQKVVVIDCNVGYTGGINLSDEYFNVYPKYGHWKDTAVRLEGEAVAGLAAMFVGMWNYTVGKAAHERIDPARVVPCAGCACGIGQEGGLVQPFYCGPMKDRHNNADMVYQSLMGHAKRYLWITSPYLVLDRAMADTLVRVAKSGVDVRIYTPRHYDKWYVYLVTEASYGKLLREGVRIFEYVPGFIHAKNLVVDDECAVCGSINLDYRSFYFHYECATVFYGGDPVSEIKRDMIGTEKLCEEIRLGKWKRRPVYRKLLARLLRFCSPLF